MRGVTHTAIVIGLGVLLVVAACRKTSEAIPDAGTLLKSTAEPSTGIVPTPAEIASHARIPMIRGRAVEIGPIEGVVLAWNAALDDHDVSSLEKLYAPRVKLYGREMSRADAVASKKKALDKQKGFKQLVFAITIDHGGADRPRANFTKVVTSNGATKSYGAYLVLATPTGKLEIVEESDETTDANLKPAADDSCLSASASAALGASAIAKSLSESITPDEADAGCTNHGLMPMPYAKGEAFVAIRLHTSCADRFAFRGLYYVSTADGCVYEDSTFSGPSGYVKLECTKDASAVRASCK